MNKTPKRLEDFDFRKAYSDKQLRKFISNNPRIIKDKYFFWDLLVNCQRLSKEFIDEFIDNFPYMNNLVEYQDISENLMKDIFEGKYFNCIYSLVKYQNVPEYLLIENIDKVKTRWLRYNLKIPKDVKKRIMDLKKVLENS